MKGRAKRTRRPARLVSDALPSTATAPSADSSAAPPGIVRRAPAADDTCPICMESLDSGGSLVWCREGCGNNVHRHCMLVWARHRGGAGGSAASARGAHGKDGTTCPMCRAPWGEIGLPEREERPRQTAALRREQRLRELADADAATHFGVVCSSCKAGALLGTRFRCIICDSYNLCTLCFANEGTHSQHTFEYIARPGQQWELADRESLAEAVRARIAANAGRPGGGGAEGGSGSGSGSGSLRHPGDIVEGSAEAQLARLARVQMPHEPLAPSDDSAPSTGEAAAAPPGSGAQLQAEGAVAAQGTHAAAEPATAVAHCAHCKRVARKQQWFKALPCGHHVHESCLPDWLRAHHGHCPTCNQAAVTAAATAAALAGSAREPCAGGAPASTSRSVSAAMNGGHLEGGPVAGRRRAAAQAAGKRLSLGGMAGMGAAPLGLGLGVTGCSLGVGAHGGAGGAPLGAGLATVGLAGRGIALQPPPAAQGGIPQDMAGTSAGLGLGRRDAPRNAGGSMPSGGHALRLRGRLMRGMTPTVAISR